MQKIVASEGEGWEQDYTGGKNTLHPTFALPPPPPPSNIHTPQLVNFKFVPLAHQLNFVLVVSVLWATFLSWSSGEAEKRRKQEEEERRGKSPENATTES